MKWELYVDYHYFSEICTIFTNIMKNSWKCLFRKNNVSRKSVASSRLIFPKFSEAAAPIAFIYHVSGDLVMCIKFDKYS